MPDAIMGSLKRKIEKPMCNVFTGNILKFGLEEHLSM